MGSHQLCLRKCRQDDVFVPRSVGGTSRRVGKYSRATVRSTDGAVSKSSGGLNTTLHTRLYQ
jgi:hypothetical protein